MIWLDIDRNSETPLYRQVYEQLVVRILKGELEPGTRLPGSRNLANELKVSRNVITSVYDQLLSEGYLETRHGSGTYISNGVKLLSFGSPSEKNDIRQDSKPKKQLPPSITFACGVPETASFPKKRWLRSLQKEMWWSDLSMAEYTDVRGLASLRDALTQYLLKSKYIRCNPEQVFVMSGTSQALDLLAKFFQKKYSCVYLEDPIVGFIPAIFRSNNYTICPVPVDDQGMNLDLMPIASKIGLIVVTPSHQFPSGSSLPIQRRINLIQQAKQHDAIILEDDYDGEFKYDGIPIQSLQSLDCDNVIHLGTFSKTLGAGLRLSYMVVPEWMMSEIHTLKDDLHMSTPTLEQEVLSLFIRNGSFERHVLKMKKRYRSKMEHLKEALCKHFGSGINIEGNSAGMHLVVQFKDFQFDESLRNRISEAGLGIDYYDQYTIEPSVARSNIILGFGNLEFEEIDEGIQRLADVLNS